MINATPIMYVASFVVIIAGMRASSEFLVPFLLAAFIAIICAPLMFWMKKHRISTWLNVLCILLTVITAEVVLISFLGNSISELSKELPAYQEKLKVYISSATNWAQGKGLQIDKQVVSDIFNPEKIMALVSNTLSGLRGMLTTTFLVILALVFMLFELSGLEYKIRAIQNDHSDALHTYQQLINGVNRYILIKTGTSLVTGIAIYIFLSIVGVDSAFLWGTLAFFLNYIPNVGSIFAAIPAILLAIVQLSPGTALVVAIGYLIINVIVSSLIEPKLMGDGVGLSVLVVFMSLAFWGWTLGPVGMLLSVPLTMTLKIALSGRESTSWIVILLGSNLDAKSCLTKKEESCDG